MINPSLRCSRTLTILKTHIKNQFRTGDYFKQSVMYLNKFKTLALHSNTMELFTGLGHDQFREIDITMSSHGFTVTPSA